MNEIMSATYEFIDYLDNSDIVKGSIIDHTEYGLGAVIDVSGSLITVAFKCGVKKLMKNHKSITKVS